MVLVRVFVLLSIAATVSCWYEWRCLDLYVGFKSSVITCRNGFFVKTLDHIRTKIKSEDMYETPTYIEVKCFAPGGRNPSTLLELYGGTDLDFIFDGINGLNFPETFYSGCSASPMFGIKINAMNVQPQKTGIHQLDEINLATDKQITSVEPVCDDITGTRGGGYRRTRHLCKNGEAVCGFNMTTLLVHITMYSHWRDPIIHTRYRPDRCWGFKANDENMIRKTIILDILPICCPYKVLDCKPHKEFVLVGSCNNTVSREKSRQCSFTQRTGLSSANTRSDGGHNDEQESNSTNTSWGWSVGVTGPMLLKYYKIGFSANFARNVGKSKISSFNWATSSQETFTKEASYTASYHVAPGGMTKVYQLVGTCGIVLVNTNFFTFIDFDKNGNVIKV